MLRVEVTEFKPIDFKDSFVFMARADSSVNQWLVDERCFLFNVLLGILILYAIFVVVSCIYLFVY